ncbi:RabGAP/TBC [Piromyces finnis]|uniref:RabGAP/TBC n=1 Tax=Piromyces finnis TaxID=1754191 RepID=A0A1Y1V6D1_9FUNG|nr:RabGAP/TBC [Piromyces finnis]|eukprot:ORX48368.1 RabGAP/TBC [Piromyces finnis]
MSINNNKLVVPNNDLEIYDDNASQNYYSSDESNYGENRDSQNSNNNANKSIPLVERVDPPQAQTESNVERDSYGFKISYQYISRESQLLFQKNYQVILERRKSRWNSLIKENGGQIPQKISKKVKRFIHKGIPKDLRPACWFKYSGAEEMSKTWPRLYKYLLDTEIDDKKKGKFSTPSKMGKSIEEIEKDLYRTFPDNDKFNSNPPTQKEIENNKIDPNAIREIKNPYIKALRNILVAFSYYSIDPEQGGATSDRHSKYTIGYCQSLNYIAGLLLLIFSDAKDVKFPEQSFEVEEKCFWMMIALVDEILPIELYEETQMHGAQIEQDVLWDNLVGENGKKFGLSGVAEWVAYMERGENIHNKSKYNNWNSGGTMPALKSITLPWMLTCFVNVLPIETVLRVWDCLFTEGSKILIRVILTLFRIFKDDITNISDGMTAWMFIKNMPHRVINCHEFMEICFRPVIYINPVSIHSSDIDDNEELNQIMSNCNIENFDENDNPNNIQSISSQNQNDALTGDEKKPKKMNIFNISHKGSKNSGRINDLMSDSNQNLSRSKSDSYRMNFKKRGVGNISQKSIDKFRKIQWDKEQNKK